MDTMKDNIVRLPDNTCGSGNSKKKTIKPWKPLTVRELKALSYGDRVSFISRMRDVRTVKVNGAPKTWKTRPNDVKVPLKYGLYEFAYAFMQNGENQEVVLVKSSDNERIRFTFTYNSTTPESCEAGDFSDHGFILFGHWKYSMNVEEIRKDILANPDDYSIFWPKHRLEEIIDFAKNLGICEDSSSGFSSVDPDIDYSTGEETQYNFHPNNVTPSTYNRIKKLLGAR